MTDTDSRSRPRTRGATRATTRTSSRFDSAFSTGTQGLTNARTRIVGNRTGFAADALVAIVKAWRELRRVVRIGFERMSAVVTALGWSMLAIVPLALLAGYAFGWRELLVVGFAGVVLLAVAAVYLVGRNAFDVTLAVAHQRVVVGERATGVIRVSNPTHRRLLGVKIEIPVGRGLAEIAMPGLRSGASFEHEFVVPTVRRGVVPVGPVRTVRADPLGLVRRELVWTGAEQLFVHPRTIAIPSTSTGLIRDLEGSPTRDLTTSDVSFHALREYVPGDERRHIHWKSTARTGTYMVRQFEETRRSHLVVALSLASGDYATEEELELAVSAAGSLGVRAIRDGRDLTAVVSGRTPEFAKRKVFEVRRLRTTSPARLLDELAVVEHAESALSIQDVARVSGEQVSGISVAFLVCGSPTPPAALRAAANSFPLGVEVVAIVCDPEAVPGLRRTQGLTVLTIGYLEDLQKALARASAA
ncbi:DUF58 domain-containing protein [Desertivibrio insolitus]|uniref:DUF58 domain-containing protein n=1 Tax=Herbiconiux sp. SYSU D00978 TaxID=2812562 RepID=UPI0027DE4D76|nr:DUF58 domain-containing protein [Herbiconiux sp. SYSU D00978]